MKQVVQAVNGGPVRVIDVPAPTIGPTEVLVQTLWTTISAGTERAVTQLAQSSLLDKARARPDLVRQVVAKARNEGVLATARTVRSRLDEDLPLGYSGAGLVVEVGDAVAGVLPGQLVATGGAGKANHAEFQAVQGLLCVPVPEGVAAADASFATIASIALHGLRQAGTEPGSKVVVVGLGLIGQLTLRLAAAAGCDVFGLDVSDHAVETARRSGFRAETDNGADTTRMVTDWSRDRGADAVIVTAAGKGSQVMGRTPALCRDRASVVVVGDVGLELDRRPFYDRELSIRFARSYGPGRYERSYEDWAVDYPAGYVRFTEGRNLETVLDLLSSGRLTVGDLVTHLYPIASAATAYELIEARTEPYLAVQLEYPEAPVPRGPIEVHSRPATGSAPGIGLVGAGAFASSVLVPALRRAGLDRFVAVTSASGLSARHLADRAGFARAVSGADAVLTDPDVDVVVVATPHESHARLVVAALEAGRHVFCEKPLALTFEELDEITRTLAESPGRLLVGFNRRWSEPVERVRSLVATGGGPLVLTYRVNAGELPPTHWYHDRRQGGRLLGEVCHFVDTCAAIVGAPAIAVQAMAAGRGELTVNHDVALLLRYADGSLATISYASGGHPGTPKERLEVLGRGHSGVIDDFRAVTLDGKTTELRPQDKGHDAQMRAFAALVRGEIAQPTFPIESMRTTLDAAAALGALTTIEQP